MDEILEKFKRGKFNKCLELLNSHPDANDIIDNLILENCKIVCESFIRKSENNPDKIYEMQELLYLFYDKVTSLQSIREPNFEKLKLVVTYNFMYWLLFYNDDEINDSELQEYLEIVGECISRGRPSSDEGLRVYFRQSGDSRTFKWHHDIDHILNNMHHHNRRQFLVSGEQEFNIFYSNSTAKVLNNLSSLCDLSRRAGNMFMLLEFIILIILYIINLKKSLIGDCLKIVRKLLSGLKEEVKGKEAVDEFMRVEPPHCLPLFKFNLDGTPDVLGKNEHAVDYLHLLESTLLFLQEDFTESLKSLQRNIHSSMPSLWTYLVVSNAGELEKWDLCSGFLAKAESLVMQTNLRARFLIMKGRVECMKRNHKKAVALFGEASELSAKCPAVWYSLGQEYGRMGLYDSMMENFQNLVMVVTDDDLVIDVNPNFEMALLDWIHPLNEITEMEAYYALAVAHGLNENFKESAEIFEKVLNCSPFENKTKRKRTIQLPDRLTILHEAAVMNLHIGNLVRAEQIAMDAVDQYVPRPSPQTEGRGSLLCKDAQWLARLIHQELLETDLEPSELSDEVIYSDELIFGLPQNVIGMLIWSEVQRIQDLEDYKQTLSSVFSTFSRYLAASRKEESVRGEELTLVKGLTGKTCLKVAAVQIKEKNDSQVDKMYKRALSCNKGDKDALHGYYTFLTRVGKHGEALKLWNTFAKEKSIIELDSLSSFSLKYFLSDKVTKRELDKIQVQIDLVDLKI